MTHSAFFNAHHSPIGAFASFTLGSKGPCGGLGLELAGPADESVYIGIEERERPGHYRALPFFHVADASAAEQADYDVEGLSDFQREIPSLKVFSDQEISRTFGASIDSWTAGDLTFQIISPVGTVPDPADATPDELRAALVPGGNMQS